MIFIVNPSPDISGSGTYLIGSRTETVTPGISFSGDYQKIIILSTPACTPFFSKKHYVKNNN